MTKRIVSGIFILTALGALGVILAGALTSGEQLIVRFLTAVIVAALGLYVISDLRLQADDDAMTSRSSGQARLTTVDAPPNSTAAFMATVTKKTELKAEEVDEAEKTLETASVAEPSALPEPAAAKSAALPDQETVSLTSESVDAGVFGRLKDLSGFGSSTQIKKSEQTMVGVGAAAVATGDIVGASAVALNNGSGREDLSFGNRRVVSSKPLADTTKIADPPSGADATVTDIFAGVHPPVEVKLSKESGEAKTGSDETVASAAEEDSPTENSGSEDRADELTADELTADELTAAEIGSAAEEATEDSDQAEDDADLTQLLRVGDGMPAPLGIVSEFKSGGAQEHAEPAVPRLSPFENGATTAKISFSSDPVGDNVSFSGPEIELNGADIYADDAETAASAELDLDSAGGDETAYEIHDLADLDAPAGQDEELAADAESQEADEKAVAEFQYSDELHATDHTWPPPSAKLNGAKKVHPFERLTDSEHGSTGLNGSAGLNGSGLNGHSTTLPVPASASGIQAADYADAPLAPIIDLRDINGQNSDNVDIAINAGELEVISTLIEQGMLSTDGPISDRDVRTMVYVAFTSNELRKLILAGGTPDGPNHGLDLGPVELFDERIHAPAPKRLYTGIDRPEPQSQIG